MAEREKSEFVRKLENRWHMETMVCVGLDSDYDQIPQILKTDGSVGRTMLAFNREIIDATADQVCAFKPNIAFYEAQGNPGRNALKATIKYIHKNYPYVPVILDRKSGDIGNTNLDYVKSTFDEYKADATTVHPYLGGEALKPFLDKKDKGIIVLVKTSNPGSDEIQNKRLETGELVYEYIAGRVVEWNEKGNCAVVVGATYPTELARVREIVGEMPILVPGIGAQGGDVKATVEAGKNNMIVVSARGIIFASKESNFAEIAREKTIELREQINSYK